MIRILLLLLGCSGGSVKDSGSPSAEHSAFEAVPADVVVITEFHPIVDELAPPWLELENQGESSIDLDGLVLSFEPSGAQVTLELATQSLLAPGEFAIFTDGIYHAIPRTPAVLEELPLIPLDRTGGSLTIWSDRQILDHVGWSSLYDLADDATWALDPDHRGADGNDTFWVWCAGPEQGPFYEPGGTVALRNEQCPDLDDDEDGYTPDAGDCNDSDSTVYPGAPESGTDGVDRNCDGSMGGIPEARPVYDGEAPTTCRTFTLNGEGSTDPEGQPLAYNWTLESWPARSSKRTDSIFTPDVAKPDFWADLAGTYVFGLTVSDGGGGSSRAAFLTVVASDPPPGGVPVASLGAARTVSESAACSPGSYGEQWVCEPCAPIVSLSAAASTDPDGDELTFGWTMAAGFEAATVSATATGSPDATLTFSELTAVYGETTSTTVTVRVVASDCFGNQSESTVDVTLQCTGQ